MAEPETRDRVMNAYPGVDVRVIETDVLAVRDNRLTSDPNLTGGQGTTRTTAKPAASDTVHGWYTTTLAQVDSDYP